MLHTRIEALHSSISVGKFTNVEMRFKGALEFKCEYESDLRSNDLFSWSRLYPQFKYMTFINSQSLK